ncbi:MAG: hypothetical protein PWQ34_1352 [Caldanaerobacter sp.]|jgi:hypothetical protein|nr:hypothetical protein [Caldanaerobacter sp.]MDI3519205.1 hypothetical protein [Caldanaerobacter sp.]
MVPDTVAGAIYLSIVDMVLLSLLLLLIGFILSKIFPLFGKLEKFFNTKKIEGV